MGRKEGGELKWSNNFPKWVQACTEKHGGKYDYSNSFNRKLDDNGRWVVPITCPEHGEFWQQPAKHKFGRGCPACAGIILVNPLQKLREAFQNQEFPDDWDYGSKDRFTLVCPEHGEFVTHYNELMFRKAKSAGGPGVACPKCNVRNRGRAIRLGEDGLRKRLEAIFPTYTFHLHPDVLTTDAISYVCPDHGPKTSRGLDLLNGHGCPDCGQRNRNDSIFAKIGVDPKQNVLDVFAAHGGRYIPHLQTINRTHEFVRVSCVEHGAFYTRLYSLKAGAGCPRCAGTVAKSEDEVAAWLGDLGVVVLSQVGDLLDNQRKIDLYLPDYNLAIEHCGLYWHREGAKDKLFHYDRYKDAQQAGMRMITLFEDEWVQKQDVVKSVLLGLLGLDDNRISGRQTEVRSATWAEVSPLYERSHLQGAGSPCKENYALYYKGVVVSAMSFRADRFGGHTKELTRYAFSARVAGGFNKLLAAFTRAQENHGTLVSYSDKRWFSGRTYEQAGFVHVGETGPGYWWCKSGNRYSRLRFQKHKLAGLLPKFDENLTEEENMYAHNYWKIWDCGMDKWVLTY